jgi:hypothetical protein
MQLFTVLVLAYLVVGHGGEVDGAHCLHFFTVLDSARRHHFNALALYIHLERMTSHTHIKSNDSNDITNTPAIGAALA